MSQLEQETNNSQMISSIDDEWVTTDSIDLNWMQDLFPTKPLEKVQKWLQILRDNEYDTVDDLHNISSEDWKALSLPLAVESKIRVVISEPKENIDVPNCDGDAKSGGDTITVSPLASRPVSQIDVIVVDISASMRARSTLDIDKTREDVSKMLFHTLIDKLICLELHHAVGLLAFGHEIHPYEITTEYEQFHDFLGRLDANEGATKLYDSIYRAASLIENYATDNPIDNEGERQKRIFVLTDGEDNCSEYPPWQVAQFLQQKNILLDAIPVATHNPKLQSMCTATEGLCFKANSQEQAINLFEREATLHVQYREITGKEISPIVDMASLIRLEEAISSDGSSISGVTEIRSIVPASVKQPVMKKEDISKMTSSSSTCSRGSVKRILKEYNDIQQNSIQGWSVYVNSDNVNSWKAILDNVLMSAPYTGGKWLVTIDFPFDYPFKPPRFKFITPIYHCNVSCDGNLCLDILKDAWNPAITVSKALTAISSLLLDPNALDPLDAYKGQLYRDDREAYMAEATSHTLKHAAVENEIIAELLSSNDNG